MIFTIFEIGCSDDLTMSPPNFVQIGQHVFEYTHFCIGVSPMSPMASSLVASLTLRYYNRGKNLDTFWDIQQKHNRKANLFYNLDTASFLKTQSNQEKKCMTDENNSRSLLCCREPCRPRHRPRHKLNRCFVGELHGLTPASVPPRCWLY